MGDWKQDLKGRLSLSLYAWLPPHSALSIVFLIVSLLHLRRESMGPPYGAIKRKNCVPLVRWRVQVEGKKRHYDLTKHCNPAGMAKASVRTLKPLPSTAEVREQICILEEDVLPDYLGKWQKKMQKTALHKEVQCMGPYRARHACIKWEIFS